MRGKSRTVCRSYIATATAALAFVATVSAEDLPTTLPPSIWSQALPATPPPPVAPATPPVPAMPAAPAQPRRMPPLPGDKPAPPQQIPERPVPGPAAPAPPPPAASESPVACQPKSVWDNVPPVRAVPPLGNFAVPPSGCDYYTGIDFLIGNKRPCPPNNPYPPLGVMAGSFFDADYRYLDSPCNDQHDWSDVLKRLHAGCNWMFTTGGEFRMRYMDEHDSRLTGVDNVYELFRTRVYTDLWYRDIFRIYAEFIYADITNNDLPPTPIDVNRGDLLNLFVDLKIGEIDGRPIYLRGGRQELLYGSERMISPLDWANTRRTFQGVKAFYNGCDIDVDAFWVKPVEDVPTRFDSWDDRLNFTGAWIRYHPWKNREMDFYALNLDRSGPSGPNQPQVPGAANTLAPNHFNITTLGNRDVGTYCGRYLWDFENMVQFGSYGGDVLFAYAAASGFGYRFADVAWTPELWLYADYASGDASANTDGSHNTFNQLFPFGHYYLGYLDLVGRQNIQDLALHLNYFPAAWITGQIQYHRFWLAQREDALYNAAGAPIAQDPTGGSSRDVGQEIDLLWNFHMTNHQDLLLGYSRLFEGTFLERTRPGSPELFYLQYTYRW